MAEAWGRGGRDESDRSPLQQGEPGGRRGHDGDREHRRQERPAEREERRQDRYVRVGVGQPSDDPALHRVFEVRASYREAAGGWVAQIGEQNLNEQLQGWWPGPTGARAFPTAAACLGDAVAFLVALVDREAQDRR